MDDSENPYEILGVPATASATEIKTAYRKLALRHHPDKQTTEEDRQQAHVVFAKISNAYEILSDDSTRQKLDREQQHQRPFAEASAGEDFFDPRQRRHESFHHQFHQQQHHPFAFHDPFEIFSQVFGEEFGTRRRGSYSQRDAAGFQDPMQSPFGQRHHDPFGGFGAPGFSGNDVFSSMQRQMDMMQHMMQQQQQQQFQQQQQQHQQPTSRSRGAAPQVYYSSSSTSLGGGFPSQRSGSVTSVSTTTRMVNGKRQTVTERVVTKPDGSVERHVESSGDDDFPRLQGRKSQQHHHIEPETAERRPTEHPHPQLEEGQEPNKRSRHRQRKS